MNSLETDLEFSLGSKLFFITIILQVIILKLGENSRGLIMAMVPVLSSLPYGNAWLAEYESGFYKHSISRSGIWSYIISKIIVCGISGGTAVAAGWYIYDKFVGKLVWDVSRVFWTACFWAVFAMTFSAICKNRYITYGGGFVCYYLLIILRERYLEDCYQLDPTEWISYAYQWPFGEYGIMIMEFLAILVLVTVYILVVWRCVTDA